MHRRHMSEKAGKIDRRTGLLVRGYSRPFDFEYQVIRHVDMHFSQWQDSDLSEVERDVRISLATGNAWLFPEPQRPSDPVQMELAL